MLKFTKADDRLKAARNKVTMCIFGPSGAGKTTQARTLDPKKTLFLDFEAGTLALGKDWAKDNVFDVRGVAGQVGCHPWELARAAALYIGGPDPSDANGHYSKAVYDQTCEPTLSSYFIHGGFTVPTAGVAYFTVGTTPTAFAATGAAAGVPTDSAPDCAN